MVARLALYIALLLFLCTCGSASDSTSPTHVRGTMRFSEAEQILQTTLEVRSTDSVNLSAPRFLGVPLTPLPTAGPGYYRLRRQMNYPAQLLYSLPCGGELCSVAYQLKPVYADSLPDLVDRQNRLRIKFGDYPLESGETLIIFFDPKNDGQPETFTLIGPTKAGATTVPKDAFEDVPAGFYDVHLIKQRLTRDTTPGLISSLQLEYISRRRPIRLVN